MEKLISRKGFNLPKSQNMQTFYEAEIEPLEKGLYSVRSGKFKGLLKERQLAELREQIATEEQEEKDLAEAKKLIEKKRKDLLVKVEGRKKELSVNTADELKVILDEMSIGYYEDAKESELIELIIRGELNGIQRVKKEAEPCNPEDCNACGEEECANNAQPKKPAKPVEKKQPKPKKPAKPVVEQ